MLSIFKRKIGSTDKKQNNTWHYYNCESDVVIVFVHGILSNSLKCWTSESGKYWPDFVKNDSRFSSPSIFLGGYHTMRFSGDYKLRDCAEELKRALERDGADGTPAPMSFENILFVCHSLGGNVVRYLLEAHRDKFVSKTTGLILMASPSLGSEYANSFSDVISFYRNGMAKQLEFMNSTLEDLDNRFKVLLEDKLIPCLIGAEAVEHLPLSKSLFLLGVPPIVTKESAARYFAHYQLLAKTTHSSIVKPETESDPGHLFLCDFYSTKYKPSIKARLRNIHKTSTDNDSLNNGEDVAELVNRVIFDVYTPASSKYFSPRSIDAEMCNALSMCSVWLTGASGFGKTTIARHFIHKGGFEPIEVCLSSCRGRLDQNSLIAEIVSTINQRRSASNELIKPSFTELANFLAELSKKSHISLYLDEVPISKNDSQAIHEFSNFITDLLDKTKRQAQQSSVRFIISSIAAPDIPRDCSTKFFEHVKPIEIPEWGKDELNQLFEKITTVIKINNIDSNERIHLLNNSNGSPRFLKIYLRTRWAYSDKSSAEVLQMTRSQFVS